MDQAPGLMDAPAHTQLPEGVQRVAAFLKANGHAHAPRMLDAAARTAQQAADALGVSLGQIAKSIVFRRQPDLAVILVITSGDRRVDERKVQALVCQQGQQIERADAQFVKLRTGFSIGGVSPLAHVVVPVMLVDAALLRFQTIWAAAGHPHAVFQLMPTDLLRWTQVSAVDVGLLESPL